MRSSRTCRGADLQLARTRCSCARGHPSGRCGRTALYQCSSTGVTTCGDFGSISRTIRSALQSRHSCGLWGFCRADYVGNLDVNAQMVREGMAWVYLSSVCERPCALRVGKSGQGGQTWLWADPESVAPWEYRRSKRGPWNTSASAIPIEK